MATSLYDLSVGSYLQILDGLSAVLDKGSAHCANAASHENELLRTRIADDMLPLAFQLHMANTHSLGSIEGIREGVFNPPTSTPDLDYAGYKAHIATTADALRQLDPQDVDDLAGKAVVFRIGDIELPFTAENFVMSFSLPNFYFHTTAAYAILRAAGVPVGKRDFLGEMRIGS
ncbi:MAG: hypothetical protein ACI87W_000083 [Halieaceae bacterium]|jgi:hypothetical protein